MNANTNTANTEQPIVVDLNNRMDKLENAIQNPKPVSVINIELLHKQLLEILEIVDEEFAGKLKSALEEAITVQLKFCQRIGEERETTKTRR